MPKTFYVELNLLCNIFKLPYIEANIFQCIKFNKFKPTEIEE